MAGALRHRCNQTAQVLHSFANGLIGPKILCDRLFSGATTSTSGNSRQSAYCVLSGQSSRPRKSVLQDQQHVPASRAFFAAVATAAATNLSPGSSGGAAPLEVPWPWVDPARRQVMPKALYQQRREALSLAQALDELQSPLSPTQRSTHSLEVFVRFGLDPRRSDHLVRGSVLLPYGTGKRVRLVVFAKGAEAELARKEGVDLIGDEDLIASIVSTDGAAIAFDKLIATPEFMKPLARAGRILGPKGLMPNPKMGTLTTDVVRAIRETRQGRLDYRLGRDGAVRAALGRASMPASQLAVNVGALVASLLENRPKAAAGGVAGAGGGAIAAGKGGAAGSASGQELEGYIRTFLLKTTYSEPRAISFQSLVEAVGPYRDLMGGQAAAAGGTAGEAGPGPGAGAEGSDKKVVGGQAGPVGGVLAKAAKPVASSS